MSTLTKIQYSRKVSLTSFQHLGFGTSPIFKHKLINSKNLPIFLQTFIAGMFPNENTVGEKRKCSSLSRIRRHRASNPQCKIVPVTTGASFSGIHHLGQSVYAFFRNTPTRSILCTSYVCMCVCVFFPFILDIKFVGRTSRGHTGGRSHRIFNPPSFCGACLDFCREKDSAIPFPRRQ